MPSARYQEPTVLVGDQLYAMQRRQSAVRVLWPIAMAQQPLRRTVLSVLLLVGLVLGVEDSPEGRRITTYDAHYHTHLLADKLAHVTNDVFEDAMVESLENESIGHVRQSSALDAPVVGPYVLRGHSVFAPLRQ